MQYETTKKIIIMAKYQVSVTRVSYSTTTIEVEANTRAEAKEKALQEAPNHSFNEYDAEYKIDSLQYNWENIIK